jgi:hypothetical protein
LKPLINPAKIKKILNKHLARPKYSIHPKSKILIDPQPTSKCQKETLCADKNCVYHTEPEKEEES